VTLSRAVLHTALHCGCGGGLAACAGQNRTAGGAGGIYLIFVVVEKLRDRYRYCGALCIDFHMPVFHIKKKTGGRRARK
jgi:hypothetical protein